MVGQASNGTFKSIWRLLPMRTIPLIVGIPTFLIMASSFAAAGSEMRCSIEARHATGEIQGFEYTQALTACMLNNTVEPGVRELSRQEVVVKEVQPFVAFSASRRAPSGTWVRVSSHRWVLRPN
jgi:hypothetical protein